MPVSYTHLDVYKRQHLDHALYQKNTGTDEFIFDKPIKVAGEFADIKNESIQCQKLVFLHVGLGKTKELDVSFKSEAALNLEPVSYTHLFFVKVALQKQ